MIEPNIWMALPFGLLLLLIALAPLFFSAWWGRHYAKVATGLAAVTIAYYLFGLDAVEQVTSVGRDYVRFIVLVGSLFVVTGGIHLTVKGEATPWENVRFLLVGALAANVLGTTGASILLIRPWVRMNRYRITGHHVAFFIFLISNVGGCLTPIGDPPLYLGYLKGVPFWWVAQRCWPVWLTGVALLLVMFYFADRGNYRRAPKAVRERLAEPADHFHFDGLGNLFFLGVVLASAFLEHPPFLREALMLAAAAGSYFTTPRRVHHSNDFNFAPIREVAILFVGIFATMMPALDWLLANAARFGAPNAGVFYFGSGTLSSVLDNAPTYLTFFSALLGAAVKPEVIAQVQNLLQTHAPLAPGAGAAHAEEIQQTLAVLKQYFGAQFSQGTVSLEQIRVAYLLGNATLSNILVAISAGSVFFGANTYIGNGPNFMVKAIAEQSKVHTPTFLGYIARFTLPYMLPMLVVVWFLFFRG